MFRLFKNDKKKTISTEHMTDDEYIAAIEPELLQYWDDHVLCEKIGIKSAFEPGACVSKELTLEDAIDCHSRICKLMEIGTYVLGEFSRRGKALRECQTTTEKEKRAFYSAATIKKLLIEAREKIALVKYEGLSYEAYIKDINSMLVCLNTIKKVTLGSTIVVAMFDRKYMIGFI